MAKRVVPLTTDCTPVWDSSQDEDNESEQSRKDDYCFECHTNGIQFSCQSCRRSYHRLCLLESKTSNNELADDQSLCPICIDILRAEELICGRINGWNGSVDQLSQLLKFAIMTTKSVDTNNWFSNPVSTEEYPNYSEYIVNPMDLSRIETNIENNVYASTTSFLADINWIYHNCIVFNSGVNQQIISDAKKMYEMAEQECEDIDICSDCYRNHYSIETNQNCSFGAVCRRPHSVVWAKVEGYPYWPAKAVRYNADRHQVLVRFFGAHDKAWVREDKCYLMSEDYPFGTISSNQQLTQALDEMTDHLRQLNDRFKGLFRLNAKQTLFSSNKLFIDLENSFESNSEQNSDKNVISNPIKRIAAKKSTQSSVNTNHVNSVDKSACSYGHKSATIKGFKPNKESTPEDETQDLESKLKSFEFRFRQLEEERNEIVVKIDIISEQNQDLRESNAEMEANIPSVKGQQWCSECLNLAKSNCCWNTWYCSTECQDKHFSTHYKTCRLLKQQLKRLNN